MNCLNEESLLRCAEEKVSEAHLGECAACRATVLELEETIGELRAAAPSVAPATGERLLRLHPAPAPARGPRRIFFAAAAILLAATAFALFASRGKPAPKPEPKLEAKTPPEEKKTPARKQDDALQAEMIAGGLSWLAGHQNPDGSIGSTALTGLSLMAFFGAGQGEDSAQYGPNIRSALAYLLGVQGKDGNFAQPNEIRNMYGDAIVTWSLVEAVGGGRSVDPRVKLSAQRAVAYLLAAQNPGMGWRYSPKCGDNDTSVTFWAAGALASAQAAGFPVPAVALDGARAWFRFAGDPNTLAVGYNAPRTGKVYVPGINETFRHHETMSAAAMALRLLAGDRRDEAMASAVGLLAADPPTASLPTDIDYYYWHLGTLALYLHDGPASLTWKDWQGRLVEGLKIGRMADGSWEPKDRWAGTVFPTHEGRAYATAINVLTLETPSRAKK